MQRNKIDFDTQIKIRKYMNFVWENEKKHTSKVEDELLRKLTENLKFEFLAQTTGKILFPLPLFSKNFSVEFLKQVLFIMKPVSFDPNSLIYQVFFDFFLIFSSLKHI